jgi:2-polyprenyl-3-methyl-5-hydroxy-6-metoxy-1,4-benzoquinol methylase
MKLYARILGLGEGSRKIDWILPFVKGRNVLDIGCGGMHDLSYQEDNWLHRHIVGVAQRCVGIENNNRIVENLKSIGYDVILGDAQKFTVDELYDVIVAGDVIEHLEDIKGFFISVREALKDDGYLILTTPNPWFFLRFLRCLLKGSGGAEPDHAFWLCTETLRNLLKRYGFEIEKMEFGSSEPIFYRIGSFRPGLFHTSIFVAARKK